MELSISSYSDVQEFITKLGTAGIVYVLSGGNVYRIGLVAARTIFVHPTSTYCVSEATFLSTYPDAVAVTQVTGF